MVYLPLRGMGIIVAMPDSRPEPPRLPPETLRRNFPALHVDIIAWHFDENVRCAAPLVRFFQMTLQKVRNDNPWANGIFTRSNTHEAY